MPSNLLIVSFSVWLYSVYVWPPPASASASEDTALRRFIDQIIITIIISYTQ